MSRLDLSQYRQIVVLSGAGISAASGLPTYRGQGGLWSQVNVERYATAAAIKANPTQVWEFFGQLRAHLANSKPNPAHLAIASAEARLGAGQQLTVLTQNIDGLHQLAGSRHVVELHGSLHRSRCTRCDFSRGEDVNLAPTPCPACPECGAPMRVDVVLFDEMLDVDVERAFKSALRACDLFVAIGTSGTVSPASNFVRSAEYAGARTVYVNLEPMSPRNPAFQEEYLGRAEELVPELFCAGNA
jgi:NAD-dependent deacetylase